MKLTQLHRANFVAAVMASAPTHDFQAEIDKLVRAEAIKALPPKVRAIHDDPELRCFVNLVHVQFEAVRRSDGPELKVWSERTVSPGSFAVPGYDYKPSTALKNRVCAILTKEAEQRVECRVVETRLTAIASTARTRKELVELLPQFEKFIPADAPAIDRTVPVAEIDSVVTDLARLGVPQAKKKVADATA